MSLGSLTISIPYHGTSESFQAEASGVQRFLASLFPHSISSLAHFAHWIYAIPLKLPLNLDWNKAVLKLALTPLPSAHSALPSPLFKGWHKPVAPRAPEATKGEWGAIPFCSSSFLHSLLYDTATLGDSSAQGGKRERAAGPEALQGQKMWRKIEEQEKERCKPRITDLMTVLWYWPATHTVLCYHSIHHSVW